MFSLAYSPMTDNQIVPIDERWRAGAQAANQAASQNVFNDYKDRKARNTIRRQENDLSAFADFLRSVGLDPGDLYSDPAAWRPITWGLVAAFQKWQLKEGYAIGTINIRLSTIKKYSELAMQSGALGETEQRMITTVKGYSHGESKNVDEKRDITRLGDKKADWTRITAEQARGLKAMASAGNTQQAARDFLLICLAADHGLRVSELAILKRSNFDLDNNSLEFYRPKTKITTRLQLDKDSRKAAEMYLPFAPAVGFIWRSSLKDGSLNGGGMSIRALSDRIRYLGELAGIRHLSPHDLRHFAATQMSYEVNKGRLTLRDFMDNFGWKSTAMAMRYVDSAAEIDTRGLMENSQITGKLL